MSRQPEHVRISPRTTPCAALSQIIVSSKIWHETLTSAAAAASAAARRARRSAIAPADAEGFLDPHVERHVAMLRVQGDPELIPG